MNKKYLTVKEICTKIKKIITAAKGEEDFILQLESFILQYKRKNEFYEKLILNTFASMLELNNPEFFKRPCFKKYKKYVVKDFFKPGYVDYEVDGFDVNKLMLKMWEVMRGYYSLYDEKTPKYGTKEFYNKYPFFKEIEDMLAPVPKIAGYIYDVINMSAYDNIYNLILDGTVPLNAIKKNVNYEISAAENVEFIFKRLYGTQTRINIQNIVNKAFKENFIIENKLV